MTEETNQSDQSDQIDLISSILEVKASGIDVTEDLKQTPGKSIAELLDDQKKQHQSQSER